MATFTKMLSKHDDYMTPRSAWENIAHLIPKEKLIWEAFYGDGMSGKHLTELGFNVVHKDVDFFENDFGDIIVSNPPFSKTKEVFARLKELGKPFVIICPSQKINTSYMRIFANEPLQIIIPRKRIHFQKLVDGKVPENWKNACNFDCFYYCYRMQLPKDILFLE